MSRWILIMLLCLPFVADAQYFEKAYSVGWNINTPLTNKDYVDNVSVRGFRFGYREFINENFSVGVDFNNATFDEHKPRQTFTVPGSSITTDLFNYSYHYGLTLSGEYFFKTEQRLMPFAGVGIGASFIDYQQYFNVYVNESNDWGVLVRPQGGVLYRIKDTWALQAAVHYDYSSVKAEALGLDAASNLGFLIGVVFLDW